MTHAPYRHRAAGFTLVEMIAACALAAVLLMALAKVAAGLRVAAEHHGNAESTVWQRDLVGQLQRDLDLCMDHAVHADGAELVLAGALDAGTNEEAATAQRPARVIYRVVGDEPHRTLIRETHGLLKRGNDNVHRDVLAVGVKQWSVTLLHDNDARNAPAQPGPTPQAATTTQQPLKLVLQCEGDAPSLETTLRWQP